MLGAASYHVERPMTASLLCEKEMPTAAAQFRGGVRRSKMTTARETTPSFMALTFEV